MIFKNTIFLFIGTLFSMISIAQNYTQTVRGVITDTETKQSIIGANVIIVGSNPLKGASTNVDGLFSISEVPVGRVNLQITAMGYEPQLLSNIVVESAKETVLQIKMTEAFEMLEQVVVVAREEQGESINEMATVSAKTVTVEETGRYAGSLNDPARSVSAFAGVVGDAEGNNDIVVRGNSPRGILWRLEGIEIPNPNHFANEGSTGGPVNTLNATMLANSDFFSGAFAPEYGNALSGVFDTRFRTGNNQKSERSFSVGVLGTDITLEGPFNKNYGGSYLVNYRYSTLELMDNLGILDFGGIPRYQDASFKVNLPTKKYGNFSIFGLGGKSGISEIQESIISDTVTVTGRAEVRDALGVIGVNHNYMLNKNSYVHSYISISGTKNTIDDDEKDLDTDIYWDYYTQDFSNTTVRMSTSYNQKINRRNTFNTGVIYSIMKYNMHSRLNTDNTVPVDYIKASGKSSMIQGYGTWKHRLNKDLSMVSGLHYTQLFLNNNYSIEPRLGMKYNLNPKQNVSFGVGLHSKVESISVYMANAEGYENQYVNENLELTKSLHLVGGFGHQFNPNLSFKTEVYYQYLYDVPVENKQGSKFSMINQSSSYLNLPMVSEGTGTNYGLELTLERYFYNQFYYLITSSIYKSKYTAIDGETHNSRFDANYAGNLVIGKEFNLRSKKNQKTLAVNIKTSLLGGNRFTPIDLDASISEGEEVRDQSQAYEGKYDDIFLTNLAVTYRVNKKKVTHEVKLDIQNVTNNQAAVGNYYNSDSQEIEEYYQLSLIPNLMYIIKF
ncbi:MAG: TonB-dependent receptor [Salibacteraceae bacterium]